MQHPELEDDPQSKASGGVYQPLYSEEFYLYSFKIVPCTKAYPHNWSSCPYLHKGEKARRRDPRTHGYQALPCPYDKKGTSCPFGEGCTYTHNVYEYWLHPARFRVQVCKDKQHCTLPLCFFAHNLQELRVPVTTSSQQQQQQGYGESSISSNANSFPFAIHPAAAAAAAAAGGGAEAAAPPAASASMGEVLQTLQDFRRRHAAAAAAAAAAGSSTQDDRMTYVPLLQPCTPPTSSQAQGMLFAPPGVQGFISSELGIMSSESGVASSEGMLAARAAAPQQVYQQQQALLLQQQHQAITMQQQQLAATIQQQQEQQMALMLMQQQRQWIEQQQWVERQHALLDPGSVSGDFTPGTSCGPQSFTVNSASLSGNFASGGLSLSSHSAGALATPDNSTGRFCVVQGSSSLLPPVAAAAAGAGNSGSGLGFVRDTSAGAAGNIISSSGTGAPRFVAVQNPSPLNPAAAAAVASGGSSSRAGGGWGVGGALSQLQQGVGGSDGDPGGLLLQLGSMQLGASHLRDL